MEPFPTIILLPPRGISEAERWVADGRLAAASDLIFRLSQLPVVASIFVLAAEEEDRTALDGMDVHLLEPAGAKFHFGRTLARIIEDQHLRQCAYFGGGSAPLADESVLGQAFDRIARSEPPDAVVNNFHSTDWMILNRAYSIIRFQDWLPSDNPLGWVLAQEAGFQVDELSACAATRLDIDTPTDLLMLDQHPSLGPRLSEFLATLPDESFGNIRLIREVLQRPASTLAMLGRASSHVWQLLEQETSIWIRAFVEERGMVASGRMKRGEVRSILAAILETWGPARFVQELSSLVDAALWDTRVWMAHRGVWPSAADRFASDIGWVDSIQDVALRELTEVVTHAEIPIVMGGHSVVSGGVYALIESI